MPKIAIFGGSGYLGNLILNQKSLKKNNYTIFSRKKIQIITIIIQN